MNQPPGAVVNIESVQKVLLVLPWSPVHQGGVTGVVQQLMANWDMTQPLKPLLVVDEWEARHMRKQADASYFRFTALPAGPLLRLPLALLRMPQTLYRTWRLLKQERVAAVNFHYAGTSPWGLAALKQLGLYRGRLVLSFHGTDVRLPEGRLDQWLRAFCYRHADAMVACSNSLADRMAQTFQLDRKNIDVVPNGVNTRIFSPEAPQTPALPELPERYVVSIGAFIPRKAHADLIQAFHIAFKDDASMHFVLAGADGPTLAQARQQAADLGLAGRVHFLVGLAPADVAHLLARAQLFVQASLAESMPLSVLEAGAVGVPVAASDIPGHDELVFEGATGRLFKAGDPVGCAAVMKDMVESADASRAQGLRLQERVRSSLTWEACVRRYMALYAAA